MACGEAGPKQGKKTLENLGCWIKKRRGQGQLSVMGRTTKVGYRLAQKDKLLACLLFNKKPTLISRGSLGPGHKRTLVVSTHTQGGNIMLSHKMVKCRQGTGKLRHE